MRIRFKNQKTRKMVYFTSQELARRVREEGRLGILHFYVKRGGKPIRCLWGVLEDFQHERERKYAVSTAGYRKLCTYKLSYADNDGFQGVQEERCEEMAKRLEAIP